MSAEIAPKAAQGLEKVAVLTVEPRVLRRVIRRHRGLSGLGIRALHDQCYTLLREDLVAILPELAGRELPERPILVPRGEGTAAPRHVFHALVHQALEKRALSPAQVRQRIHAIGQTEFDEIRFVLKQDDLLLPPREDTETYIEFAARYLELRYFAPAELERTFPSLLDREAIDRLVGADVGEEVLGFAGEAPSDTEAEDAGPEPETETETGDRKPATGNRQPAMAERRGNLARAAIFHWRAGEREAAEEDLRGIVARLPVETRGWVAALGPLVEAASAQPRRRTVEARLLYDLVKAGVDRQREAFDVDVGRWLRSFGRVPIVRPLPSAFPVRYVRHLRHAVAKLGRVRLTAEQRRPLERLVRAEHARATQEARDFLEPRLAAVFDQVGLVPRNVPERVARGKLTAELLDRVVERGFLTLGHIRDAVARNGLKLGDLRGPIVWWTGDELLRADALLRRSLDGVYRRGEIYLRALQKLSSIFFGTPAGRALTLYLLLPVVAAYVALEGVQHIVGPLAKMIAGVHPHIFTWARCGVLAVLVFAFLHSARLRSGALAALRAAGRALHTVFVDVPSAVWRAPPVQRLVHSRAVLLVGRWLIKPLLAAGLLTLVVGVIHMERQTALLVGACLFVALVCLQATSFYAAAEEWVVEHVISTFRLVGHHILPGLFRLILDLFTGLLDVLDRFLVAVDERLRFRKGDGRLSLFAKGALGLCWGAIAYLIRIYVNLLAEPTVNPIKHFPVVTVAGKIMLPLTPAIVRAMVGTLAPLVGGVVAGSVAGAILLVLPGFWGFLVWELKENWRLYAANRPRNLGAIAVGSHGETVGRLLRPGLHSGTVPKAYHKLRRATWKGDRRAARHRETLHHVEEAIERFVARELVALLEQSGAFPAGELHVAEVHASSNRIRITLARAGQPAVIAFEEQSGWIVGARPEAGWTEELPPAQREALDAALAGLWDLAGADLLRDDLERRIGPGIPYDVADEGLIVWPDGGFATEVVMPLGPRRRAIAWDEWVARWSS